MANTFQLVIRTPEQDVFSAEVQAITLTTEETGVMTILKGHASLSGTFLFSPIKVVMPNHEENFIAKRGVIFVSNEEKTATLMALSVDKRTEISLQTIQEYMRFIEEKLKNKEDLNQYQLTHLENEKLALEHTLKAIEIPNK